MKEAAIVRVRLDEAASTALAEMITILGAEGQHLSLIPSRVVSVVVYDYASRYFAKDKGRLIDALLDRKACLRAMLHGIKDGSNEEIERLRSQLLSLAPKRNIPSQPPKTVTLSSSSQDSRGKP